MTICAISTAWRSNQITEAKKLVDIMKETGISTLELEFRMSKEIFKEIKTHHIAWGINIVSLHSVCPSPPGRKRGAEHYFISDEDEQNRIRGVEDVKLTLRNAAEIGAQVVIVHCGRVPIGEPIDKMKKLFDENKINSKIAKKTLKEILHTRTLHRDKSFQSLLKSLDEINKEAEELGIGVGLENRYYFNEYPNLKELEIIFKYFNGSKLAYWHDTGHSHVHEILFGVSQKTMLETFNNQLIGIHLHDVVNGYSDHNEPGCGMVDFDLVKSYLKPDTIRVMEINQRVSESGAKQGIAFLKEKGIFSSN